MKSTAFHPNKRGVNQYLGERQTMMMEYLWKHGPLTPVELHRGMRRRDDIAYTTVFTELSRMLERGLVTKAGRHPDVKYTPAISREALVDAMVADVIGGLINAHSAAAIRGFVDLVAGDKKHEAAFDEALQRIRRTAK